jgi:hypothetical protein
MMMWPDSWGPLIREMRERELGTGSGYRLVGPWAASGVGLNRCPSALFIFFLSFLLFFFLFPISFITFANLVQIESNQFVNFSKIQIKTVIQ